MATRTQKFIQKAIDIANDSAHGYSQFDRWNKDFDCSSLAYICGYYAGYNLPTSGTRYTGTIIPHFSACGFRVDEYDGNLSDLEAGDLLLNTVHHVAIYIGNGKVVEAYGDEKGGKGKDAQSGDQTGQEIRIAPVYNYYKGWTHVLTPPKEEAPASGNNSDEIKALAQRIIELA